MENNNACQELNSSIQKLQKTLDKTEDKKVKPFIFFVDLVLFIFLIHVWVNIFDRIIEKYKPFEEFTVFHYILLITIVTAIFFILLKSSGYGLQDIGV